MRLDNKYCFLLLIFLWACKAKQPISNNTSSRSHSNDTSIVYNAPRDTFYREKIPPSKIAEIDPVNYYEDTYSYLNAMLEGREPMSFEKAVFAVENAYFEHTLEYSKFSNCVTILANIAKNWTKTNRLNDYRFADSINTALNAGIFYTLTDTVFDTDRNIVNMPYTYSFDDCFGKDHWTNMFVTKLMITHQGNCHSLPFLYKMVADRLNAKVWLSFTPNHIYLRNRCKKTGWYNTELTNAMFPSEAWIMTSGYVSTNSIVSGIYMDTLGPQQSIAVCVNDLAKGYERKFKNPDLSFVLKCCDLGLKYYPNYAELLLLKAETLKQIYEKDIEKYGLNAPQSELHAEHIKNTLSEMEKTYGLLAKLDYRELPEQMYMEWMKSLKDNKERFENKEILSTFQKPTH